MGKINNPNGKKGGDAHSNLVNKLSMEINKMVDEDSGKKLTAKTEYPIPTPKGKKKERFLDVAGVVDIDENPYDEKVVYMAQVGKTDANGLPVKREMEAIEDIENVTQIHVNFYDYKTQNKIR